MQLVSGIFLVIIIRIFFLLFYSLLFLSFLFRIPTIFYLVFCLGKSATGSGVNPFTRSLGSIPLGNTPLNTVPNNTRCDTDVVRYSYGPVGDFPYVRIRILLSSERVVLPTDSYT